MIKHAFNGMVNSYQSILNTAYPARGSTGFTEENQTFNFVFSLKEQLKDPDLFYWFEFPWMPKQEKIDAVVYSPLHKSVYYIEAKRIKSPTESASIAGQIKRVCETDREFLSEHGITEFENEYVIALCDVWLETAYKKSIPHWFSGFIPECLNDWNEQDRNGLLKSNLTLPDQFDGFECFGFHWFGGDDFKNYCLMAGVKQL